MKVEFDRERARVWLESPYPEAKGQPQTWAEHLNVVDDDGESRFGYESCNFHDELEGLVGEASTAGMFGSECEVSVWLIFDEGGCSGGLVTVDLLTANRLRLAGNHADLKHLTTDREAVGINAALAALEAVTREAQSVLAQFTSQAGSRADTGHADELLAELRKAEAGFDMAAGEISELRRQGKPVTEAADRYAAARMDLAHYSELLLDHIRTTGEVPTGWARVALSDDARAVVVGLVTRGVNRAGIRAPQPVWDEIRRAFPQSLFEEWAARRDIRDGMGYDPSA